MSDIKKMATIVADYQHVFGTDQGKRVLLDLIKHNHILNTDFSSDPLRNAYSEGERSVVLRILNKLKVDHRKYLKYLDTLSHEQLYEGEL